MWSWRSAKLYDKILRSVCNASQIIYTRARARAHTQKMATKTI